MTIKTFNPVTTHYHVEELFDAEARLRELATELQTVNNYNKVNNDYYRTYSRVVHELDDATYQINNKFPSELSDRIIDVLNYAKRVVEIASVGITEDDVNSRLPIPEELIEMNDAYKSVFGENCAYTPSLGTRTVTAAMLINDAAACIHRIAEAVSNGKQLDDTDCEVVKPGEVGEAFCKAWYDFTNDNVELYHTDDLVNLKGWVIGNKVYLRVGSSEGHRTYVNFNSGELTYYDYDEMVNRTMKKILEEGAGLSCKFLPDEEGVKGIKCTGVTKDKIKPIAAAVSLATSMDYRLRGPENFYSDDDVNRAIGEVIREKYSGIINEALGKH